MKDYSFDNCTKCTICTVYCPVSRVTFKFPGPKQAGPDGERLRLKSKDFYDDSLKYCTNCKTCEVMCPSDVKIGDIIQRARIQYSDKKFNLRNMILSNTDLMGSLSVPFAPIANSVLSLGIVKSIMDKTLKIDKRRSLPKYSRKTFRHQYKALSNKQSSYTEQVLYFHGCYVNYNYPQLGLDLIKILNHLGIGVQLINEKCCGVPLIANGFQKKAIKQATHNTHVIREHIAGTQGVIATSSTCCFTLRDEYDHLLQIDNHDIQNSISLATRYLYDLIVNQKRPIRFKHSDIKVAYHVPCHMRKLGWENYTYDLLKLIPGLTFVPLPSQCCGIAGTYGFKKENYEISQQIGSTIFTAIEEQAMDFVVSDCETCKWQIEMSTQRECLHPITLLAQLLDEDS